MSSGVSRRGFLKATGVGVEISKTLLPMTSLISAQNQADAFKEVLGKDQRMIVHNWRPGVLETPLELLRQHRVTPKELLFVRNNQVPDNALSIKPLPLEGWIIEVIGLVKYPRRVRAEDLTSYQQTEVEMVLQCSGNGRAYYASGVRTRGTQWQKGGVGNVRWGGVPVRVLVEQLKLEVDPAARFITAEGSDSPAAEAADFEHSLPLEDVLDRAILALRMNGEPIPAIHGGPVRLIIPGYYGTMNIKWLSRLRFGDQETNNYNHMPRYRTFNQPIQPGTSPLFTFNNSTPNWHQRIKSMIWRPLEGGSVPAGRLEVSGVAWNDGLVKIEAVDLSTDGGRNWRQARLDVPSSPYSWYLWDIDLELPSGLHELWARAVDTAGRTQPLDGSIYWNPSGYEWNGVDKVNVSVP